MDETMKLINMAHEGDKAARDQLVMDNVGLIWSIVRRFSGRGYEMEDLFQIGSIGLIKAIDKFDTGFDVKFSTYAVPMITGEIKRFLRDDGMIKVSRSIKELGFKVRAAREEMTYSLGREPTIEEIAARLEEPAVRKWLHPWKQGPRWNPYTGRQAAGMTIPRSSWTGWRRRTMTTRSLLNRMVLKDLMEGPERRAEGNHSAAVFLQPDPDPDRRRTGHFPGTGVAAGKADFKRDGAKGMRGCKNGGANLFFVNRDSVSAFYDKAQIVGGLL